LSRIGVSAKKALSLITNFLYELEHKYFSMSSAHKVTVSKRKLILAIVAIALVCSLASGSIMYVVAQSGGSLTALTLTGGPYPGAPTYTVFTDGTNYYAKDAQGAIDFTSTDASIIVTDVLANNVVVLFSPGTFLFKTACVITNLQNFIIEGSGFGSYPPQLLGETTFEKGFNGDLLTITYTTSSAANSFGLENFQVYGNDGLYSGQGIVIGGATYGPYNWWMQNVKIYNTAGNGLFVQNAHDHQLTNVFVAEVQSGNGISYYNTYDWQWYGVESDCNTQIAGYAAVCFNSSAGQINGGHFEGWRSFDVEAGTGSSSISIANAFIPWSEQQAIYVGTGNIFLMSNTRVSGANQGRFTGQSGSTVMLASSNCQLSNNFIGTYADSGPYSIYDSGNSQILTGNKVTLPVHIGNNGQLDNNYFYEGLSIGSYCVANGNNIISALNVTGNNNTLSANIFPLSNLILSGSDNQYVGNVNFVTESDGTFNCVSGTWVNDNLAGTANSVIVASGLPEIQAFVNGWSTTQFRVIFIYTNNGTTPSGSVYGNWLARYDP